jgi:cell division protein ZapA
MAEVTVNVGGRGYAISCRDGEEAHLHMLAGMVDEKARVARQAIPGVTEARLLLFAALFLADELTEAGQTKPVSAASPDDDADIAQTLEAMAERMDKLAARLTGGVAG